MKTTVKYKVLFNSGKKGTIKVDYDCPDFEHINGTPITVGSEILSTDVSIEQQIDEWVSSFDKRNLMDSHDIMLIFDWKIVSAKPKETNKNIIVKERSLTQSELVGLFVISAPMSDELKKEFAAVYSELKTTIKDLSFDKQIDITFKSLSVGMKAASEAYRYINDFMKSMDNVKTDDHKNISWGETIFDKDRMLDDVRNGTKKNV
jgi:hypothetical protein